MANWSRALIGLSQGLNIMAGNAAQRERDEAMAMREENLMRLRASLEERSAQAHRDFVGEQGQLEHERNLVEIGTRGAMDQAEGERRFQQQKELGNVDFGQRKELLRMEQEAFDKRAKVEGKDEISQTMLAYSKQFDKIDERIRQITDKRIQATQESSTSGVEIDPTIMKPWDEELAGLRQQRAALEARMDEELATLGAPGYRQLSPEEVKRMMAGKQQQPSNRPAAQARQPSGVPAPPPKPARMIEREQRKSGKRAILENASAAMQLPKAVTERIPNDAKEQIASKGRDVLQFGRDVFGPEPAAVKTLKRGGALSEAQKQELRSIGRSKLKGLYRVSDSDLSKIF